VRAVLDPNVVISGVLSPRGAPADVLRRWERGDFEVVVSTKLLEELERALAYPKLRRHVDEVDGIALVHWLSGSAAIAADPAEPPPTRSADPGDDYLIALAASERTVLVSGDKHLLALAEAIPVYAPREFLELLGAG
jgi:putative PIN family toxin of toxin-antitoxin system